MVRYTITIIFLLLFFGSSIYAQKEDYQWLFGSGINAPFYGPGGMLDTTAGITIFDYNFDPPRMKYDSSNYSTFFGCNANASDKTGSLLFSSNGFQIYSGKKKIVLEDTIAFGQYWKDSRTYNNSGKMLSYGSAFVGAALILPMPGRDHIYQLYYSLWDNTPLDLDDIHTRYLYSAEVDMNKGNGLGEVIYKDHSLLSDSIFIKDSLAVCGYAACRHANGRDWWLLYPGKYQNKYYTFLIDPTGLHFHGVQNVGKKEFMGVGQSGFSPDGRRYVVNNAFRFSNNGSRVELFDFDRCTGKLSNPRGQNFEAGYGVCNGQAFSPDSRYVYISNDQYIYQYDFYNPDVIASRRTVAVYDDFLFVYPGTSTGFPVTLGWMGLTPDGKILVSSGSGSNHKMGIINYPNERGEKCEIKQHSIHVTTNYYRAMPNFPNYRLGPLDGSSCDTLGLDNNPIAKYRYEQDTSEHLKVRFTDLSYFRPESWSWDFGDGTTSTERYPYHTFPKNGSYEVCLTVSNENSSNTTCRTLTFGTASTEEVIKKEIDVNLYPNPVKDVLNLTIYDYLPQNGVLHLFDSKGQKIKSIRVYHGWNNVDMTGLLPGVYLYNIVDGGVVVKNGKVVKS